MSGLCPIGPWRGRAHEPAAVVGTILIVVLVLAVGSRVTDGVRLRQQEAILAKLPTADAVAFYKILRRRVWKVRVLRAVTLLSLLAILHARNRAVQTRAGRLETPAAAP